MGIEDYIVKGSEWSQGDYIKNLTPDVRGGYCRSLVIYWLSDVNIHHEITITRNFQSLIQGHTGNLKAIAKAQADTAKIGSLNGLSLTFPVARYGVGLSFREVFGIEFDLPPILWTPGYATAAFASNSAGD